MRVTVVRGPSPAGPFELRDGENHAGRSPECEIFLPSKRVSRKHAVFLVRDGHVEVRDLGSHNGILAGNGSRVERLSLVPGERVQVGDYLLLLDAPDDELELEEDELVLDDETAESPDASGAPPVPPPPALPFATRGGFGAAPGFGAPPAPPPSIGRSATPSSPGAAGPAPGVPVARQAPVAPGAPGARPPAPAATPIAARPAAPAPPPAQRPVAPAPAAPSAPAAPARPTLVAPAPAPHAPAATPSARPGAPIPPPPALPFPPSGGFGAPPRTAPPPDPSRSIMLEPEELSLDEGPPPPWNPNADPDTSPGVPPAGNPEPTVSVPGVARAGIAASAPPPFAAPGAPAARTPGTVPAGGFAGPAAPAPALPAPAPPALAPPPPVAARPAAPPPPAPRLAPRTGDPTATAPVPAARPAPVAEPVPTTAGGLAWFAQAALLVLAVVGLVLCAPVGGVLSLVQSRGAGLEQVSLLRGAALAESLANRNAQPLAENRALALDTAFLTERPGVRGALVTDKAGTVLAPAEKLRTSVAAFPVYAEISRTGEVATLPAEDGLYHIAAPIRGQIGSGPRQIVGYALVEYDPAVVTDDVASPVVGLVAGFVVAGLVAGMLVGGAWWLVLRPLAALREETELALLGDHHDVVSPMRLPQMEQLAHSINRVLARARAAGGSRR